LECQHSSKNVILLKTAVTRRRVDDRSTEETKSKRHANEDIVKDTKHKKVTENKTKKNNVSEVKK